MGGQMLDHAGKILGADHQAKMVEVAAVFVSARTTAGGWAGKQIDDRALINADRRETDFARLESFEALTL